MNHTLLKTNKGQFLLQRNSMGCYCPFALPQTVQVAKPEISLDGKSVTTQAETFNNPQPCGSWCPLFDIKGHNVSLGCSKNGTNFTIKNPDVLNEKPENPQLSVSK